MISAFAYRHRETKNTQGNKVHLTPFSCRFGIGSFDRSTWEKGALYLIKHSFILFYH